MDYIATYQTALTILAREDAPVCGKRPRHFLHFVFFFFFKCIQSVSRRQRMLTGLLHCHGIELLVPGLFPPAGFSMQLPVSSVTPSTIPTSLLVFEGNIFIPFCYSSLLLCLFLECKLQLLLLYLFIISSSSMSCGYDVS